MRKTANFELSLAEFGLDHNEHLLLVYACTTIINLQKLNTCVNIASIPVTLV